ncbi:MAG: hypothetical protein U0166_02725 [Acidobacteriota bacterium]
MEEVIAAAGRILIPEGVTVTFNGERLEPRVPDRVFEATLTTEIADTSGALRRTRRKTSIRLYTPRHGESAWIYELGIPVVETGDRWGVDIQQKVPLGKDRDNVPPAFLQEVRTAVLNEVHASIAPDDAAEPWVRAAAGDPRCSDEATRSVVTHRFTDRRVAFDPSDLEANHRAVAAGYMVVSGGSMSAGEWCNARRAGAVLPAGKVTGTSRPLAGGPLVEIVPEEAWTPGMREIAAYAMSVARLLIGRDIAIRIVRDMGGGFDASYGDGVLTFNLRALGASWFERGITEAVDELLLHELAHEHEGNHLSDGFHAAICRLAARMIRLVREGLLPQPPGERRGVGRLAADEMRPA